jgi:alpha-amylase
MRIVLLVVAALAASCAPDPVRPDLSGSPSVRGVVVHLFEWRWADVAEECETVLGPLGWSAVQVSPPSENHVVVGRPWWERYQPVSYRLETRSGNREAFADMVRRCDLAGVDVIADVILNHMTDADLEHPEAGMTGTGTAGTRFEPYEYPGLYGYDDFHHCGLTPNDDIGDWDDRAQLQECELVDLADLDTGSPRVRGTLAAYLRDLAGLGVAGIRIDAARHVPPGDLAAILDSADWAGYVVMEVADPRDTPRYTPLGDVTDFAYGSLVSRAVREGTLDRLHGEDGIWTADPVPGDSALVFIDNHDNQRGHGVGEGVLMHRDGAAYELAVAFMLAYGRGRPRVMSSFAFETSSQGPPTAGGEDVLPVHGPGGAGCGTEWVCEHRRPVVSGMVGFHGAADGTPVERWRADAPDRVSFARGARAFAAFNASDTLHMFVVDTGLAPGEYCDVAEGPQAPDGRCAGRTVTVGARGEAEIPVPPMGATALHVAAMRR